jgi:hypothetical protein
VKPKIPVCQMATALPPSCIHNRGWRAVLSHSTGSRLCLLTLLGVLASPSAGFERPHFRFRRWSYPEPAHPSPHFPPPRSSTEFKTSADPSQPAFNAQTHTETSLALLPSHGKIVLVDSMCCVAIPGLVVVRSRLLGPAAIPGTVVVALLTDYFNVAKRATSSTCQKTLSQTRRQ